MKQIRFGMVGAGWRAAFYLRIARALPDRFAVTGVVVRNAEKRERFARVWGCPVHASLEEMLAADDPLFVVTSVPWPVNPGLVKELVQRGKPVLSETPPALDLAQMTDLYRTVGERGGTVQVAEQYFLQPHHAARLEVIRSGVIGTVSQAQISAAHGYHGISLIRKALGVGFEGVMIRARAFTSPLVDGPGRDGPPDAERLRDSVQEFFWLEFGDQLGFMDFTGDQYFSWIRDNRVLIRGERGEIVDNRVSYLKDYRTPVLLELRRREWGREGNLEGVGLQSVHLGDDRVYANPLSPAALSDDEIAVGTCLLRMAGCALGGDPFYPLAEACQDHYLNLLCRRALETGEAVRSEPQEWA